MNRWDGQVYGRERASERENWIKKKEERRSEKKRTLLFIEYCSKCWTRPAGMTSCFDGNYRLRAPRRIKANAWRTIRLMSRCIARCQFTLDYPWVLSHRNSTPLKRRKTPSTLSAVPNICPNEQKEVMHHSFLLPFFRLYNRVFKPRW